jgi:hypothetical protein
MRKYLLIALALIPFPAVAGSIEEAARMYVKENPGNPSAMLSDHACMFYLDTQQVPANVKNCNVLREKATTFWRNISSR